LQLVFQSVRSFVKSNFIQSKGDTGTKIIRNSVLGAEIIPVYVCSTLKFIFLISLSFALAQAPHKLFPQTFRRDMKLDGSRGVVVLDVARPAMPPRASPLTGITLTS
jgi:hypothetical protein